VTVAIDALYILRDWQKGRTRLHTIEELDEYFREVENCFARSSDEGLAALNKIRFTYKMPRRVDPFSQEYRQFQMDLYRQISGRDTYDSYVNERSEFDFAALKDRPFPYFTQSHRQVGEQLMAQGHVINSLSIKAGSKILEFGAGWGNLTTTLALMGHQVTAVEIDPLMNDMLRHRAATLRVPLTVVASGMLDFDTTEKFDAVIFYEAFHHCIDPVRMLDKVTELLNPTGVVVFASEPITIFPYPWGLRTDGLSLWSIRKYGWLELGFDRKFWHRLLAAKGFSLERRKLSGVHIASLYIGKKTGRQ